MSSGEDRAEARRSRDQRVAAAFAAGHDDATLREIVVGESQSLVRYLAARYDGRGEGLEDLIQVGQIGLLHAIDRFDPARGVAFSTYAAATIVGELKRHFRDRGWAVHVSRGLKEISTKVNAVLPVLTQSLGHSPTFAEIASELGVTETQVIEAVDASRAYAADPLEAEEGDERAPIDDLGAIDERFAVTEVWTDVAPAIRALPARERRILYLRFFEHKTQSAIAADLGISQMHVSRLLTRTLEHLRTVTDDVGPRVPADGFSS
jgi:RNA polymerase sigma-B factor